MLQTIFTNGIGYEGKVTLTLKSDNRVLESKTYKNNGTVHLFNFLGQCLIGSFEEAARLLPTKILLLENSSPQPSEADPAKVVQRSLFQPHTQVPTIISDSNTKQVKITYSFEVAKASIEGPFNQIALYGSGMTYNDIADFSAYYFLTDNTGAFDSQKVGDWSATTILLVEWELTISNKNIETTNS